jgi:xanthine dehydrogenase accessory factor
MRKRAIPEARRGLAPLTVGLGPGFVAGDDGGANVDLAIETSWRDLSRVIARGPTLPLAGDPRPLGGHSRDRFIYAPIGGIFRTDRRIGDRVAEGGPVARIEGRDGGVTPLLAPLDGTLRGLTRDGVPVARGTKVVEVDPRGAAAAGGIGERPGRIADGVLRAIAGWGAR